MSTPGSPPGGQGPDGMEPPSDDVLAAELVLGVLDSAQRRSLQTRADSDRAFAERVAYWEGRFAPWLSDIEPVDPPARVWTRVCQRLGWQGSEPASANLRGSLAFWRAATALSAVVAIVAIGALLQRASQMPVTGQTSNQAQTQGAQGAQGQPVTPLWHDDGTPAWLVSIDRVHGTVLVVPVPTMASSRGRVPELWVISPGQAPRSLGLVSGDRSWTVRVPEDLRAALVSGSVLAVSMEPAAGAPHATPAGPIVAKGSI